MNPARALLSFTLAVFGAAGAAAFGAFVGLATGWPWLAPIVRFVFACE